MNEDCGGHFWTPSQQEFHDVHENLQQSLGVARQLYIYQSRVNSVDDDFQFGLREFCTNLTNCKDLEFGEWVCGFSVRSK
jgi:hypothetical protein